MNNSSTYGSYFPPASIAPIELTYTAAQDLVTNSTVKFGQLYLITNTFGTDFGALVTGMQDNKSFSLQGSGGFLNPDYQILGDYSGVVNVTSVIMNGGNVGVWSNSNQGDVGDLNNIVIWNGSHYQCIDTGSIDGTNPTVNTNAYALLPKSAPNVGYIEEWDDIEYDFNANYLVSRSDKRGTIISDDVSDGTNTIVLYQWGNDNSRANIVEAGSQLNNINQAGSMLSNRLSGGSIVDCSINMGTVSNNTFTEACVLTMNISSSFFIGGCSFNSASTYDLSGITQSYSRKILSPHLSTFDTEIDASTVVDEVLAVPDYIGIIRLNCTAEGFGTIDISDFTTTPSFERYFTTINGGTKAIKFLSGVGRVQLPSPSIDTTLTMNGNDFIKLLINFSGTQFIQTASEQY